jgi:transmembrane sensor
VNDESIVRVLSGRAGSWEADAVRRWRRRTPENEAYFQATLRAWEASAPAPRPRRVDPSVVRVILEEAARRRHDLAGERSAAGRLRSHRPYRWVALAAAVAAVALGIGILFPSAGSRPVATWAAGEGDARTVALADGSLVRIAPGGRLDQLAPRGGRHFRLDGKALFAVAHDGAHPFVVEAGSASVRVLGTRFEIAPDDRGIRTVVLDGTVSLSNAEGSITITEGGAAYAPDQAPPTALQVDDARGLLRWPGGVLVFQATPLSRVAEDVARHFGRAVTVEDAGIGSRTLTGWFGPETFEEVLESVCEATGITCAVSDSTATLGTR